MIKTIAAIPEKKGIDWRIVVAGITGLTIIEVVALCNGINGIVLTSVIGVLALAVGVAIPSPIKG